MRSVHRLPELTFELGTIIFSPGIGAGLLSSSVLQPYLNHVLECHAATDFGIISKAMRFDNLLAALMETGYLTFRYFVRKSIGVIEEGVIITTDLDEHSTTIRFTSEQF